MWLLFWVTWRGPTVKIDNTGAAPFEDWEDRKLNHEFSINFCKTGRITIHPDNNKEILAAAKKLYEL